MSELNLVAVYGAVLSTVLLCLRVFEEFRRRRGPAVDTEVIAVTIHNEDDTINDTAIKITIHNPRSERLSVTACTVGFLDSSKDETLRVGREAQFRDEFAKFPLTIEAGAATILYSYGRHLHPVYEDHYPAHDSCSLAVRVEFAGSKTILKHLGDYIQGSGLSSLLTRR